jgi:purine-binding chemotaxis protein CheW
MDQEPPPPSAAFDMNEIARLNDELKQLRQSVRQKKLDYDKAKREGKRATLDLRPELIRLSLFVQELDQLREKLKSSAFRKTDRETSDAEALRDLLLQMRNQLMSEKANLEEENTPDRSQDQLRHEAEELRALREQLAKDKGTLEKERDSLELLLTQVKEEQERLKSTSMKARQEVSLDESTRLRSPYDQRRSGELEDRRLEFLVDQLSVIKTELRDMREHFVNNERTIESKQRELESRRNELAEERGKIEQERKALETRIAEAQDDFTERTIQKIRGELQSERMELASLRKSIQQIRSANTRERKVIERDRDAVLRVQIRLEREKQRIAQKAALLELRERRAKTIGGMRREVKQRGIKRKRAPGAVERRLTENVPAMEDLSQRAIEGEGVILGVKLGAEDYGIDTTQVREIIRMREITPIPRQPPYVEGVMNVRGVIIPVVNLKKRFGLQQDGSKHPHIVIVESAKGLVGMLVDSVSEVIRVPAQQVHPPPQVTKGIDGEYLRGICRLGDKLMIYLDLEKLLEQAVPIDRAAGLQPPLSSKWDLSQLSKDERKTIRAIPSAGKTKLSLGRRVGFSTGKLDRVISSLQGKGLIKVTRVGNSKLIRRTGSRDSICDRSTHEIMG